MLVGLTGKKQSGKSTVSERLVLKWGFIELPLASPLKKMVHSLLNDLGVSANRRARYEFVDKEALIPEIGVSYRWLCQSLGTEWGRNLVNQDIWKKCLIHSINFFNTYSEQKEKNFVIPDIRFDDEAELIRNLGGVIIQINRTDASAQDTHPSETGITLKPDDIRIFNNGTIKALHEEIELALFD